MFASFPSLHRILYLLAHNHDLFLHFFYSLYQNTLVFTQSDSFYSIRNFKWALLPLLPISMFLLNPFILSIMSTKMTGKISNKSGLPWSSSKTLRPTKCVAFWLKARCNWQNQHLEPGKRRLSRSAAHEPTVQPSHKPALQSGLLLQDPHHRRGLSI